MDYNHNGKHAHQLVPSQDSIQLSATRSMTILQEMKSWMEAQERLSIANVLALQLVALSEFCISLWLSTSSALTRTRCVEHSSSSMLIQLDWGCWSKGNRRAIISELRSYDMHRCSSPWVLKVDPSGRTSVPE